MLIRGETPADIPAIHALNKAAFDSDGEPRLVDELRANNNLTLSLVAIENGEVAGHIAFSPMGFSVKSAGLAPLAVAEKYRKQGMGAALVQAGIEKIKEMAFDAIFVLGSDKYYPRFGFLRAIDFGIQSPYPDTETHFFVMELRKGVLENASGPVAYAPEFGKL
jgi:putative acetyltransferase